MYNEVMKKLVIVADDFGLTDGVSRGCVDAHLNGILQELSLMVGAPGMRVGLELVRQHRIANVGIHITLNDMSITGKYLRTPQYHDFLESTSPQTLQRLAKDELTKFEDTLGRLPTHVNSHHNVHLHPKVRDFIIAYCLDNRLPMRRAFKLSDGNDSGATDQNDIDQVNALLRGSGVITTDAIVDEINGEYDFVKQSLIKKLAQLPDDVSTVEMLTHPAFIDDKLKEFSSLVIPRERDRLLLQDKEFGAEIAKSGCEIHPYRQLLISGH